MNQSALEKRLLAECDPNMELDPLCEMLKPSMTKTEWIVSKITEGLIVGAAAYGAYKTCQFIEDAWSDNEPSLDFPNYCECPEMSASDAGRILVNERWKENV